MAYQVVVSPLIGVVFDKLNSLIQNKFGEVWGVQKEMKKLSKTLSKIKYVLNDAEQKQVTDEEIRDWLRELKDVAYAAEDVLEEWEFQDQQLASGKVTDSLKELMENFDELAKESGQFDLQKGVVDKGVKIPHGRKTGSFLTEPEVYGREEDRKRLVSLLLAQCRPRTMHPRSQRPLLNDVSSQEDIFVCSILGMGGLGKTTLAQMVYNDKQLADHFQVKSWVCVSNDFNATRLIKAIIVSVSQKKCDLEDLDPLQKRLQKELNGKRFLVVFDDVWNDNQDEWNNLKGLLRCGKEGSCVIVTTRLETVASITGTIPPYRLHPLREDHCWSLFKQYAFGLGNKERPALVGIGKEIVAKCRGLPLAAKALGGLLRFQSEENQWLSVKESKIWELPQNSENNILSVLELSYNNLPPALKQCFVYCSIFPKDHEINRTELIQLWIANGFIKSKGRMELEDDGNEIFHALLWRCFFQDVKKDEDHSITTCKMHDYVHDLASYIAADECSIVDATSAGDMSGRTRHLSEFSSQRQSFSILLGSVQRSSSCLRSLISLAVTKEESLYIFSSLMHIRALELCSSQIDVVPDCIGKMIHLRYLKLSSRSVESLPDSMCSLRNFQTLKLEWCQKLQSLPKDMRNMSSLRHLDIQDCYGLTSTPAMIGELTCLRTLSIFIVGLENGCSIKELQGLNHLGGELTIQKLENVKNSAESSEANLMSKKNLHSLTLSWSTGLEEVQENVTEVMEGLQPHSNLRRCFVEGYQGVNFPSWMTVSALPNLVEIKLSDCTRCVSLPPLGKLPLLKKLYMDSMDSVKFIDGEIYGEGEGKGFPSLETVIFRSMPNLEGWSSSVEAASATTQLLLPCVEYLSLLECPKMKGPIPLSSSLRSIQIYKCNETVLGYVRDLPCLSTVSILEFDELVSFPEGALQNLTSLGQLVIRECKKLKALPVEVENLTTLTYLSIHDSAELVSLGEEVSLRNLLSLKTLSISRCPILKRLPKLDKTCLENLYILHCPELEFSIEEDFEDLDLVVLKLLSLQNVPKLRGGFPVALKHATMLETLEIISCCSKEEDNEMDLPEWIGTLTSLQRLGIHGCKNRRVLPEGLQNLTALVELSICGCHEELERRCEKDKGEDWFKIAHVPKVYITSQPLGSINDKLKWEHFSLNRHYR